MTIELPDNLSDFLDLGIKLLLFLLLFVLTWVSIRILKLLKLASIIMEDVAEIVDTIHIFLWKPAEFLMAIIKKVKSFFAK